MHASSPGREIARFRVGDKQAGLRLDQFLKERIPRMSRTGIQQRLVSRVELPGRNARPKASLELRHGDVVVVRERVDSEPEPPLTADLIPRILYADDDLVAVDKPAGLSVHANRNVRRNHLIGWLRDQLDEGLVLAHRIDRETSGIVVAVRGTDMARTISTDFERGRVGKQYLAVVHGSPPASFTVDSPVGRDERSTIFVKQRGGHATAGPAQTRFAREPDGGELRAHEKDEACRRSLVRAFPATGRRHQIRVHLSEAGYPIVGDKLYAHGDRFFLRYVTWGLDEQMQSQLGAERHLLHAAVLEVRHPRSGRPLRFEAPIPAAFDVALDSSR